MQAIPIVGRSTTGNSIERVKQMTRKRREIFGDNVEFSDTQPKIVMNGKTVNPKDIKAIQPSKEIKDAFTKAATRVDKMEEKELNNLVRHEDIEAVIEDFRKYKKLKNTIQIPVYDATKEGELDRLKGLFKDVIKTNTNKSIIVYKQALLIGMVIVELVAKKWGYEVDGLFDIHLANIKLYDMSFVEMNIKAGGKSAFESMSPTTQLIISIISSTLLFCLMRWMGQTKEASILATTTITGMMGGEDLPNSGENSTWDTIMGLAPVAMGFMSGIGAKPHIVTSAPVEAEKSPVKKGKRISLPVNISKK